LIDKLGCLSMPHTSTLALYLRVRLEFNPLFTSFSFKRFVIYNGSFTLATFVSETAGNSDMCHHLTVLALATLGSAIQIGSFLFLLRCPRWPRLVSSDCCCRWHYLANFYQWKYGLRLIYTSDFRTRFCNKLVHY